jgi:hypothetical protein
MVLARSQRMSKRALVLFAIAACDDDIPARVSVDGGTTTSQMREWRAELQSRDTVLAGSATLLTNLDAEAFTVSITLRGDLPTAVRYWHVYTGSCDTGGTPVGEAMAYPYLVIGDDGVASVSTVVFAPFSRDEFHHVTVRDAAGEILACGNFLEQAVVIP